RRQPSKGCGPSRRSIGPNLRSGSATPSSLRAAGASRQWALLRTKPAALPQRADQWSRPRNAAAAGAFFERAIAATGVTPERVVTDKAACSPPEPRTPLPAAQHRTSKYLNNGLERDHGHLKQRLWPMHGFKHPASTDGFTRGHALVQNLRNGFSTPTDGVHRP